MSKKLKKRNSYMTFSTSKNMRNVNRGENKTSGDMKALKIAYDAAQEKCFICLERRGTLASSGKYVCSRCRKLHGYR